MNHSKTLRLLLTVPALAAFTSLLRADLESYVETPDDSYAWEVMKELDLPEGEGTAIIARLTSQTWKGIPWKHWLTILRPAKVSHPVS